MGVVRVGSVAKTSAPLPVSSVIALARFAEDGVARNVAIPVASPETPVEIGSPVALVNVADVGVPRIGATKVTFVPSVVAPVIPPNDPALLYCNCVFEPPGVPLPPLAVRAIVTVSPLCVAVADAPVMTRFFPRRPLKNEVVTGIALLAAILRVSWISV